MALVGRRDGRNFGYGRQLSYAGRQALEDLFAGGHFATVKAHGDRWQAFVRWCRSENGPGYNDARQIDQQTLKDYAAYLRQQIQQGKLCTATAQNRLSSVNRTLAALRGNQDVRIISPSKALGQQRSSVRVLAPDGQDRSQILLVLQALGDQQHERVAAIVMLARATGMRLREAILADLPRLRREAEHLGRINIQDGTKGGRSGASAARWITVNEEVKAALKLACEVSPAGSRNLLHQTESYIAFLKYIVLPSRGILHSHGIKGFHELRAAFACERYQQLTGLKAPVNGGQLYTTDRKLDLNARQKISQELGHNRVDVVSAYIGGRACVKPMT
ncbi:integrase domain-containing protein [Pseudomonas monteilii]|uniref:integrase domain-containing protein n=1 Tax=Pseudomonas monteilii TaxID=76759 RepID=UPI0018D92C96|nr:integrase domain-containing protein [Pseudomonas monteilii]MBH3393787.1 integrase domain-containing protein [Pseudomonas monteilii]